MQNRPTCVRACTNRGLGEWKQHKQCCLYPRPEKTGALSSQIAGSIRVTPIRGGGMRTIFSIGVETIFQIHWHCRSTVNKGWVLLWPAMEGQKMPATNNASKLKLSETKRSKRQMWETLSIFIVFLHFWPRGEACGRFLQLSTYEESTAASRVTSRVHPSPEVLHAHRTRPALFFFSSVGFLNTFLHFFFLFCYCNKTIFKSKQQEAFTWEVEV